MPVIAVFVASCDDRPPQPQADYSQAQSIEPIEAPSTPAPTITVADIAVTFDCEALLPPVRQVYNEGLDRYDNVQDPAPQITEAPRVATGLTLIREDGSSVRFSDQFHAQPEFNAGPEEGRYHLTIRYEPQGPSALIGRPLAQADGFTALTINGVAALAHQGLRCSDVDTLVLNLNGKQIARATDLALDAQQTRVALPDDFRNAGSRVLAMSG